VRIAAMNALAALRVTEALDPLAAVLRADADPSVKSAAAGAIGAIGGPRAVTLLAASLESANGALRAAAVHGVSYLGPEGAPLGHLLVLASETEELHRAVCVAIAALGRAGRDAEPALIRILSDPDDEARRLAASVYLGLGWASPEGTKALAEALFDSNPWVRGYAATALGQLADRSALPALVRCYEQYGDDKTREAAVFAIGTMGAAAPDQLPFLRRVRDEESGILRLRAAWAAASVAGAGPDRDTAVAISVESLGSPELAQQAITNLAMLGPAAAPAIPRLRAMLGGGWMESMPAAGALLRIEGAQAKDALGLLTRYQREENLLAMSLLADWGTVEAAALLREGLGSSSPVFRRACAAALGRIRPAAAETLAALKALLEERDWAVRTAAARALDELS